MNKTIITVGPVTNAIRTKKLLQRLKIQSKLVKIDTHKDTEGCSHGIEFPASDFYTVAMFLRNENIEYSIYKS